MKVFYVDDGKLNGNYAELMIVTVDDGYRWTLMCESFGIVSKEDFDNKEKCAASALEHLGAIFGKGEDPECFDKVETKWDKMAKNMGIN